MEIVRQLLGAVMPGSCLLCGAPEPKSGTLCSDCLLDLPRAGTACPGCGTSQASGDLCGRCQNRRPPLDRVVAAYEYDFPVDRLIHAFKYHKNLLVAKALTPALAGRIRAEPEPAPRILLPVPLHGNRLSQRGFNQSLVIAKRLARALNMAVDAHLLRRHRDTLEQARLGPGERRRNLRAAFSLSRNNPYSSVVIVDDVITTGTTASELARLLRRTGTKEIQVWALARTNNN